MSRPSFLLFLLLAAAGSFHAVGARVGNVGRDFQYEARVDVASLMDDVHEIRAYVDRVPHELKSFWDDAGREFRTLKADLMVDARLAAKRISALIKKNT
jgi:hypothetical protein